MQRNPAYYLLEKNQTIISEKNITKTEKYILIRLPTQNNSSMPNLYIKDQEFILLEHHFSIYTTVSVRKEKGKIFSPFHYTAKSNTLSIHVYFDCYGQYVHHIVKNTQKKEILVLTPSEEMQIKRLAHLSIQDTMNAIISELAKQENTYKKEQNAVLTQLETISPKKIKNNNKQYSTLLTKAIDLTVEVNRLSFKPNYGLEKYLTQAYQSYQATTSQKKPAAQEKLAAPKELAQAESAEEEKETFAAQPKIKVPTRIELEAQHKQPKKAAESPIDYITRKNNLLHQLWTLCPSEDLNFILSIINKENQLEKEREEYLEDACVEGNIQTVQALFNEDKDFILAKKMIHIAMLKQHNALYQWLFPKKSLKYFRQGLEIFRFDEREFQKNPLDAITDNMGDSEFALAYKKNNLEIFSTLLASGEANPNQKNAFGELILYICIKKQQNDFAKVLLNFGANPTIPVTPRDTTLISQAYKNEGFSQKIPPGVGSKHQGHNALCYAAYYRNEEMFTLLLNLHIPCNRDVFEAAMRPETRLSKKIIEEIIKSGFTIDNPFRHQNNIASTLYFACALKKEDDVDLLLELGADPLAKHETYLHTVRTFVNPLLAAILHQNYSIAYKIIFHFEKKQSEKTIINRKEIHRTLLIIRQNIKEDDEIKNIITKLHSIQLKAYHQEAMAFYEEEKFEKSHELFEALFDQFPIISFTELPTILYDYSCCLYELAKIQKRNGHFEKTKESICKAIDCLKDVIDIRKKFWAKIQLSELNLFQPKSITKKALEKLAMLVKEKSKLEIITEYSKQAQLL